MKGLRKCVGMAMASVMLVVGCHKSPEPVINISGYTATDETGNILWSVSHDSTDWRIGQDVPAQVRQTLDELPLVTDTNYYAPGTVVEITDTGYLYGAYPNPCIGAFVFYETKGGSLTYACKYALVDNRLHIFSSGVIPGHGRKTIAMSTLQAGMYRLYYSYYDAQGQMITSGYGDIKKQ